MSRFLSLPIPPTSAPPFQGRSFFDVFFVPNDPVFLVKPDEGRLPNKFVTDAEGNRYGTVQWAVAGGFDANFIVVDYKADDISYYLAGGLNNDIIIGGERGDIIVGNGGRPSLVNERDFLFGRGGDDLIYGENGDDFLSGDDGHDLLVGGHGEDTLVGGNGFDLFVYDNFNEGRDVIKDFKSGTDLIVFNFDNFVPSRSGLRNTGDYPLDPRRLIIGNQDSIRGPFFRFDNELLTYNLGGTTYEIAQLVGVPNRDPITGDPGITVDDFKAVVI